MAGRCKWNEGESSETGKARLEKNSNQVNSHYIHTSFDKYEYGAMFLLAFYLDLVI